MPVGTNQVVLTGPVPRHSMWSLSESECGKDGEDEGGLKKHLTPLERLTMNMCHDEKTMKEILVGRRVGFYQVRGQIGYGSFSKVKLAFHALTKGKKIT